MNNLLGKQTWSFNKGVYILSRATASGPKEGSGPIGSLFDKVYDELHCGQNSWELAERALLSDSINLCLEKVNKNYNDIDLLLAGDLINQIVSANYAARQINIPFLGIFGACSTSMEGLAIASALVESSYANYAIAATCSHNSTAERQFRYPTEYGGQKPETATTTVTGGGAVLVSKEQTKIKVTHATIGKVQDLGITDPFDMGSAMAPAAADTIRQHFIDTNRKPEDYDLIVTGDLSAVGKPICEKLLLEDGFDVSNVYNDCGLIIYKQGDSEVFAGGSGCACSALVTYSHLLNELESGNYKRILVVATGALLNPTMIQQKESIPCIAHAVAFEYESERKRMK
ncbi:MAG: stage sporulation protein [Bacillales bacterium]|jgi:stage V sporulation protein AD|nr:stage sporulation protein [Bacillales bacterium]